MTCSEKYNAASVDEEAGYRSLEDNDDDDKKTNSVRCLTGTTDSLTETILYDIYGWPLGLSNDC